MAVTSEQLLVNVAVNTENASKSLDLLAKELSQLRGELNKTGKSTENTEKAVTDFGFSAVKLAGVFTAVEKSAKMVGKAIKFAFGDQFMKDAADQFDKLGAEIQSAIAAGLDIDDLGKEALDVLKDVVKGFQEVKPAVSEAIATVKDFVLAIRDGLMAIDWATVAKALAAIGAAAAIAFAPAIIAAVGAFAASMVAAAVPIALIALKIAIIAAGLAALAGVVAIVVKNFDLFRKMIAEGLLLAFTKAKAAMMEFGVSTLQLLTKIVAKAGELFPSFAGAAAAAVNSLTGSMVELAEGAKSASAEAEILGDSLKKSVDDIDLTPVTDVIDTAKAGWDAFTNSLDKSAAAGHKVKSVVRLTAKELEEAKKRAEEFKKAQEDLAKFMQGAQQSAAAANATELQQINLKAAAEVAQLTEIAKRLAVNGKITDELKKQLELAAASIDAARLSEIDKKRLETLKEISEQNMLLGASYAAQFMTERQRLDLEESLAEMKIDQRIEELKKDGEINKEAIAALESQKSILGEILKLKKEQAAIGFGDVADSLKGASAALSVAISEPSIDSMLAAGSAVGTAISDAFSYGITAWDTVSEQFSKGLETGAYEFKKTFEAFKSGDLLKGFAGLAQMFGAAIHDAFDVLKGGPFNKLADFGEMIANIPDELMKALGRLDQLVDRFLSSFPQAVQKVLEALPKIVDKIVEALPKIVSVIVDALPALAEKLGDVIPKLVRKLAEEFPKFLGAIMDAISTLIDALPEVFDALIDNLPRVLETFFDKIPQIFASIFKAIPTIFESLMDNIDEIVLAFVQGIIEAVGDIVIAFVDEFIMGGGLERIVGALLRAIPKIAIAFVQGVARGLSNFFKKLFGGGGGGVEMPKIQVDTKQISNALKTAGRKLSGEASKVFAVMDLGDESKDAADKVKDAAKEVAEAYDDGLKAMKNWWEQFVDALKKAWMWVYDNVIKPLLDGIKAVWMWVYDNVLKPAWDAIKMIWQSIYDNILKPFVAVLSTTWNAMVAYLKTAWDGLMSVLKATWDAVTAVFKAAWDGIISIFKNLWDSIKSIWQTMMDLFGGKISLMEAVGRLWETILNTAKTAWEALSGVWKAMFDGGGAVLQKVVDAFNAAWTSIKDGAGKIGTAIWDAMKTAFEGATKTFNSIGTGIWDGLKAKLDKAADTFKGFGTNIWDSLKSGLNGVGDLLKKQLDAINPANLFSKMFSMDYQGKGTVEKTLGIDIPYANFAAGGMVPGSAVLPGDSKMNDRIVALLSPGEAIIPRSKMDNPAIRELVDAIINGKFAPPKYFLGIGGSSGGIGVGNPFSGGGNPLGPVFDGLSDAAKGAFGPIAGTVGSILNPDQLKSLGDAITSGAVDLRSSTAGAIANAGQISMSDAIKIVEATGRTISGASKKALDDVRKEVAKGQKTLSGALKNFDPKQLWKLAKEEAFKVVTRSIEATKFHSGGLVGYANGGQVPALLQPGEFVMNRGVVSSLGAPFMSALNSGQSPSQNEQNITLNFDIKTTEPIDESFFRNRLMPKIKEEIRRAGLDGQRIVPTTGVY